MRGMASVHPVREAEQPDRVLHHVFVAIGELDDQGFRLVVVPDLVISVVTNVLGSLELSGVAPCPLFL
jgi:hypothetical protein